MMHGYRFQVRKILMKDPILYTQQQSILSGESTLDEFNFLINEMQQQGRPSRFFYDFVGNHQGSCWDKKFFDVALAHGLYELADSLIAKVQCVRQQPMNALKMIHPCTGISSRTEQEILEEKNDLRQWFIFKIEQKLTQESSENCRKHLRQMMLCLQNQVEVIKEFDEKNYKRICNK